MIATFVAHDGAGWSVSYVQEKRHGTANSGYISSGFFGGLMLGRIVLMWLNRKVRRSLAIRTVFT